MTIADPTVVMGGSPPYSGPLLPVGSTASAVAILDMSPYSHVRSAAFVVDISAFTSGTLTVVVSGVTSSGYVYLILSSAALGAAAITALRIGQALTAVSNLTANDIMPATFQVSATVSGGGVLTYGIDYVLG